MAKTFNFELVISGLVVVAVKSSDPRPESPEAVDIIFPNAHGHRSRLSYDPLDVRTKLEPDMVIDKVGFRTASLDLCGTFLDFVLTDNSHPALALRWGAQGAMEPSSKDPKEEELMDWLPSLDELGFHPFAIPAAGSLPDGASARVSLPPGELVCAAVIRNADDKDEYLLWAFPATVDKTGKMPTLVRAVANEVVFRAKGLTAFEVRNGDGVSLITSSGPDEGDTLRMCVSNDMEKVPKTFSDPSETLEHLKHLDVLAKLKGAKFEAPYIEKKGQRTGEPICDGAMLIYAGKTLEARDGEPAD